MEEKKEKNVIENGVYSVYGLDSGEISFDTEKINLRKFFILVYEKQINFRGAQELEYIWRVLDKIELHAGSGAKRIWKVKSISQKEIIFEVVKFG